MPTPALDLWKIDSAKDSNFRFIDIVRAIHKCPYFSSGKLLMFIASDIWILTEIMTRVIQSVPHGIERLYLNIYFVKWRVLGSIPGIFN